MALDLLDPMTTDSDSLYEVIDGLPTEMTDMSVISSVLASRLATLLNLFARDTIGEGHTDVLFKLPTPADRNRRPDVAFVPFTVWPRNRPLPNTNAWIALPALCVEVVSPTDLAEEVMTKVTEYLTAGVELVWVIYPMLQVVIAFDSPTSAKVYGRTDPVPADPVVPGFTFTLAELIPSGEEEPVAG